jgi:nitroreductase
MRLEDCRLEAEGIIAKSHFEANARISELEEILHAFLRAPSTGSDGPGSSTIVIQEYHLRDARAALKAAKGGVMTTKAINIVFDGPPGPEAGRFVEVETDDGESIKIGEWEERPDGLWALRITQLPWHHSKQ